MYKDVQNMYRSDRMRFRMKNSNVYNRFFFIVPLNICQAILPLSETGQCGIFICAVPVHPLGIPKQIDTSYRLCSMASLSGYRRRDEHSQSK